MMKNTKALKQLLGERKNTYSLAAAETMGAGGEIKKLEE